MTPITKLSKRLNSSRNRLARFYDNGGESADRYTAVYLKPYNETDKWYGYRAMSESPCHPQGIGLYSETRHCTIDFPSVRLGRKHKSLGKRIRFSDLPQACQDLVIKDLSNQQLEDVLSTILK